ncbi:uncharacterized protein N7498_004764 [Penicillium cinerascens]|uniref:Uncharacterized protein n=1 Tax=Penicillium cinerascens TaxID=70096 RepID=A0A9W9SZX8_9EURO|nr:uncharacterized protein N7498_004764 [Penicillium cinerascens]KAJ5203885.1 hypothetical protein N7498_004764 [Penicillium cinerascens]
MTSTTNFGALTTTWAPPSNCAVAKWVQHNTHAAILHWGAGCESGTLGYASTCYPTGWSGSANNTALSYKGFSPGLDCPSGWGSVTSTSGGPQSQGWNPFKAYITKLAHDEIATVCCPSGYDFRDVCYSQTAKVTDSLPLITTSGGKCSTTTVSPFNGKIGGTGASAGVAAFQAYPIILVNGSSSGLSTGAKIAIGVCVPAGVLIIAAICFIWWHRRRRRAQAARTSEPRSPAPAEYTGKPELDANEIEPGVPGAPAELPTLQTDVQKAELPAFKSPATPQAELPGDFEQIEYEREGKKEDVSGDVGTNPVSENQDTQETETRNTGCENDQGTPGTGQNLPTHEKSPSK